MLHLLYSRFVRARRRYYERRPDIRRRLASPVISVGNLTVGGSGKTPIAAELARWLIQIGERPSILSRGYARRTPSDGVVVVSDGKSIRTDVAHAGDEPYMLARAVPGAAVVVCPSRYLAGRLAESRLGCTVHVLDDGFQHLSLMRNIDLLVAVPDDFADVRTLPSGRFREPLDAAHSADALLVPLGASATPAEMGERLNVKRTFGFERKIRTPAADQPAYAFAGIAKPGRFFADLELAGWRLTGRRAFPDHHPYSSKDLDEIDRAARESGSAMILTTSKDAVRIPQHSLTVVEIPLEISIDPAFGTWLEQRLNEARAV
ncbi:MAG TPA: tetraacyldisaccharide 4'-kinase [Vicinamibacterales bacterium]|nr:tetraacyldisaccharide 4'-kinase [Vicinamibacterales bacterium]